MSEESFLGDTFTSIANERRCHELKEFVGLIGLSPRVGMAKVLDHGFREIVRCYRGVQRGCSTEDKSPTVEASARTESAQSPVKAGPERLLYPQKEAAVLLGVSVRQVGYFISRGDLKSTVKGGRRLIHIDNIRKFAKQDTPVRSSHG